MAVAAPDIVEQILDQLEPVIARQRRAVAHEGCMRAISSTQLHVLFMLMCDGPSTMSRLADSLDVSLPNVTGLIDRMVENGLVERGRADDRRVVTVLATDAGRNTVEEIDLVRRRQLAAVLNQLTAEQQERALRTFTDLRMAAEALHREEQGEATN